jgi:uncharacterized glyoxalase superfamily protein PhnB
MTVTYGGYKRPLSEILGGLHVEAQPEDMPWGARAFSLVDPDGFKITISGEM